MKFKNQENIFYLTGYLLYIIGQPSAGKMSLCLISLALGAFGAALFFSWVDKSEKNKAQCGVYKQLERVADGLGGLFTLFFILEFIPKSRFIETHLALFGLLVLTFLATRDILPGLNQRNSELEDAHAEIHSAVGLPTKD